MLFWILGEIDHYSVHDIICMIDRDFCFTQSFQCRFYQSESLWVQMFRFWAYLQNLIQYYKNVQVTDFAGYYFSKLKKIIIHLISSHFRRKHHKIIFYEIDIKISIQLRMMYIYTSINFWCFSNLFGWSILYEFMELLSIFLHEQLLEFRSYFLLIT